jgi:hypothetical protein
VSLPNPPPEPPLPYLDPWTLLTRVCHDLARDAVKSTFTDARLSDAVRAAASLLEALGVRPMIADGE